MKKDLEKYLKQKVVLDTRSAWVYIGILEEVTESSAVLLEVDAHNNKDTLTSREVYVLESLATGIKANRKKVYVNLQYVVSFSPLEEVKQF
ncbi:MAG: hypothetical protein GY757_27065 [bacterium]|nr:hypothetical protein [bacterium]